MSRLRSVFLNFIVLSGILLFLVSCNKKVTGDSDKLLIFSAASLTNILNELADTFEVHSGYRVNINTASSGTLARQIVQGANPDIFISASQQWANYIDSLGFFENNSKIEVAQNKLVLVTPKTFHQLDTLKDYTDLASVLGNERISIGDPAHVPAGKYARQALRYYGVYSQIDKLILPAKDVRSALMIVEMGECNYGIVYKTDARRSGKVSIIGEFPAESHVPIVYTGGICKLNEQSESFFSYIQSPEARVIWEKYGFH